MTTHIVVDEHGRVIYDLPAFAPTALSFTSRERAEKWIDQSGARYGDYLTAVPLVTVRVR